MDYVRL